MQWLDITRLPIKTLFHKLKTSGIKPTLFKTCDGNQWSLKLQPSLPDQGHTRSMERREADEGKV
jgi:hypothetical protein